MTKNRSINRKVVVVGDGFVGKTHLILVFRLGHFPENYAIPCREQYPVDFEVENQLVELDLWDTAGQEEYDRLRPLSYPDTHVILVCFSVDNPESFENVESKWLPEITHFCPGVPFILLGCKADLRDDSKTADAVNSQGKKFVAGQDGENMAMKIGANAYLECSAKKMEGIQEILQTTATIAYSVKDNRKRRECVSV